MHVAVHVPTIGNRRLLRRAAMTASLALICASGLFLYACESTPPTMPEIGNYYDQRVKQVQEARDEMLRECQNASDPIACADAVRQWYREAMTLLNQARDAAINENWQDSYDRRKAWEEKIRDMLPDFPKIKDISLPFAPEPSQSNVTFELDLTPITVADPCEPVIAIVAGAVPDFETTEVSTSPVLGSAAVSNPCFMAMDATQGTYLLALTGQSLSVSGSFEFESGSLVATATVAGSVSIAGAVLGDGSYAGRVNSGALTVNVAGFGIATLNVISDEANLIDIAPGGSGTITALFAMTHSNVAWNAMLPGYVRYRLPVTRSANGALAIEFGPTLTSDLVPFTPHPLSDYNGDGVWDYTSDLAAFMQDWTLNRIIADRDDNEIWDSNDIDLWTEIFWHDALHD